MTIFDEPDDATPLSEEENEGLKPSYISNRAELNQAEQQNIIKAEIWARSKNTNPLDIDFLKMLHKKMFGDVWTWAGRYRDTERNIGIDAYRIGTNLKQLIDDVQFQIDHHSYSKKEIAVRFHHRLVSIHPFPNGNGRHSRLATDILLDFMGEDPFTWGAGNIGERGQIRSNYIAALQAADNHDYKLLIKFVSASQ